MLSIKEIKQNCFSATYNKGFNLFCRHYVTEAEIVPGDPDYSSDIDEIRGRVEGSGYEDYEVVVGIDNEEDTIAYYECECKAFQNYFGMCKHCVALALEYRDRQIETTDFDDDYGKNSKTPVSGDSLQKAKPKRQTAWALRAMMEQYGHRGKGYILEHFNQEIDFVPEFKISYSGELTVEFKIGARKKYVVKNIATVLDAVERVSEVAYGKNLKFIHDRTVFTPEALAWIERMRDIFAAQFKIDNLEAYGSSYYNNTFRTLNLGRYGTQCCIQAYIGKTMEIDKKTYTVVDENPRPELTISNQDNEGAVISAEQMGMLIGHQYTYLLDDHKIYQCSRAFCQDALPLMRSVRAVYTGHAYPVTPLYLSIEDYRLFCKNMLPIIEPYFDICMEDIDFDAYMPEEAMLQVYLSMTDDESWCIEARCKAVYGEQSFDVLNDGKSAIEYRDLDREYELRRRMYHYFKPVASGEEIRLFCEAEEDILGLVQEGIRSIEDLAEVFVDEKIRRIQLKPSPKVTIGVSIKSDLLMLDFNNDLMHPEEIVNILSAYRKKKKYFRMRNGDIISLTNEDLGLLSELSQGLLLNDEQIKAGNVTIPKFRVNYIDDAIRRLSGRTDVHRDAGFRQMVRGMREFSDSDFDVPKTVNAKLRTYQKAGFRWLATLASYGLGGVLADDMGLGKTLQVLTYIALKSPDTLIVCPASLVYNWESEIHKFTPSLSVTVVTGNAAAREKMIMENDVAITVTSYDLLKRDVEFYKKKKYTCMVIDEAQYIKNAGTQSAKAVKSVNAAVRFALTGTPIENRLSDLWSIFDFIMPGYLYTYSKFKEEFENPIVNDGDETVLARIRDMVTPFILRRKKQDVLKDLPDKLEETVFVKMGEEQAGIYKAMASRLAYDLSSTSDAGYQQDKIKYLAELTKLRQVCCAPDLCFENYQGGSAKMDACLELMANAVSGGHKILVFSQFTQMLEKLINAWKKQGNYLYLSGKNTKEQRRQMVEQFQAGDTDVFFISLKAGGTGLNLTVADMVIHYDPWWNVAAQNQATDRTHRIGQKNVVNVMKLVTRDTIEEGILKLQEKKARLAEDVIEGRAVADSSISRDDLLALLGGC